MTGGGEKVAFVTGGEADEIADAVLWPCADRSSHVVGQAIAVGGGFTSR